MLRTVRVTMFAALMFAVCHGSVHAVVTAEGMSEGTVGLGLNVPGVGVRYFFLDSWAVEARGQIEKDIWVAGARLSRYFRPVSRILPYLGVEADYVSFKSSLTKGTGYVFEALAGGEYFVWQQQMSVQLDFGPAYLALADKNYDVDVSGIEFIVNFGINYYF